MEENKKTFKWKLNLFDLLVLILAVLAVAAVVFLRFRQQAQQAAGDGEAQANTTTVRYTIEITQMPPEAAEMIQVGDVLYERARMECMGTIESFTVGPTQSLNKDQNTGDYYWIDLPGKYTATIVLVSSATEDERVIITEGIMGVRAGATLRVCGPGYYGYGAILSVDRG